MRKILKISLGLVALSVLLFVGIYFLFPETLFKLAVKAGRYSAGLVKKEIQVDDHNIVYLEGGERANGITASWFWCKQRQLDAIRKVPDR